MKTQIYKPIVIAALSIFSLTVNAQNTKSLNGNHSENYLLANVEKTNILSDLNDELNNQIMKLGELIRFNPKTDVMYIEPSYKEEILLLTEELEKDAKFSPEESLVVKNDELLEINEIKEELAGKLKFNPSESLMDPLNDNSTSLDEIMTELETVVRYRPTNIQ